MKPIAPSFSAGAARSENPEALTRRLTNSVGAVLDPIFSLRRRVTILPNERFQFALVTVVAESREAVVALAERYSEFHTCARAFETAWTHSQLEMRRLHIRPADVQTFQQLAGLIVFPQAQLRPPPARLGRRPKVSERSGDKAFPAICRLSSS